jgi:hypothetical protein
VGGRQWHNYGKGARANVGRHQGDDLALVVDEVAGPLKNVEDTGGRTIF